MEIEGSTFAILVLSVLLFGIVFGMTIGVEHFGFNRLPLSTSVKLSFIDKKKVYRTGYKDGEKDTKEWKCKLKRNRKIKRMERNLELVQNQYCELYLQYEKCKFQRDEK